MFRLVARQWQTPRGARRLPQLRAGSQYVKPFRPCIQQLNSAILIPSSVTDTVSTPTATLVRWLG
jgi:hypothetical protein